MPSPFPGMDPWLEDSWIFRDVHEAMLIYMRETLNHILPVGYFTTANHLVWVDESKQRYPDVAVASEQQRKSSEMLLELAGLTAVAGEPLLEEVEETYLEIREQKDHESITAIEILSKANKTNSGDSRAAYRNKQRELLSKNVKLVEIDLLRKGLHTTAVQLERFEQISSTYSYHVSVTACRDKRHFFVKCIDLNERLSAIGIPLNNGETAPVVDLQELFDRVYDTGRYSSFIRSSQPPDPPLDPEQQQWAASILQKAGLVTP